MFSTYRKAFNAQFTEQKYNNMLQDIYSTVGYTVDFKICETPIFIPTYFKNHLVKACTEILAQMDSPNYRKHIHKAVPPQIFVPNDTEEPVFLTLDFAVCDVGQGSEALKPQLIEMQGFPSLYCFQNFLNKSYRKHYEIPDNLTHFFDNHTQTDYMRIMREVLVGDSAVENTILLEVEPEKQKTKIDFTCTEMLFGIRSVCITKLRSQGKKLYYERDGRKIWVDRIYSRLIFDELLLKKDKLDIQVDLLKEWDVEWIGHPNWFCKMSKFTLPFLDNEYVPKTWFLNELPAIPDDLENYVLKPLYSFAGSGVKFDVERSMIEEIPDNQKHNFILMKKVNYAPAIETLDINAKAEIRMLWLRHKGETKMLTNLVRLSKGKMLGVDFNKDKTWVGGSLGYFEK
jgi:hypothetical protein